MKNLDAGDWGLLECEEKKYDAKQTASFSDDLVRDFQDYHDRAKELEAGYGRYYNNTTHVGKAAEASKEFIGRRQTDEIHFENLDIQREFLSKVFYIENAFKDMVDPSPNAKIDSVVLKKIKQEQHVFSRVFDEEGYELERWTKMMVEEFGKFGVSTLPSCSLIRELYEELSGPGGHLDKCNKRLKEFDEYCLNYLKQSGLKERVYNLQCTIKNTACGLDGLTVYTPCMAKNPIDVIKKIINIFNPSKKSNDKPSDEVEELRKEKIELKKAEAKEKQEEQRIYAYIQKKYGLSQGEVNYLIENHKGTLLALYGAIQQKSPNENEIYNRFQDGINEYRIGQILIANGWDEDALSSESLCEINTVLKKYNITSKEQICMFLAECTFESGCGKNFVEQGSDSYFAKKAYGKTYRGGGAIQITWKYGYQAFATYVILKEYPELGKYAKFMDPAHGGTAETIDKEYNAIVSAAKEQNIDISKYTQIVTDGADYVASNYAWETAGYFWEINTLNQEIDEGATIDDVSKVVNSGNVSTFGKRRECYQRISSSYDEYYSD